MWLEGVRSAPTHTMAIALVDGGANSRSWTLVGENLMCVCSLDMAANLLCFLFLAIFVLNCLFLFTIL